MFVNVSNCRPAGQEKVQPGAAEGECLVACLFD
jgi:hypothetical protein